MPGSGAWVAPSLKGLSQLQDLGTAQVQHRRPPDESPGCQDHVGHFLLDLSMSSGTRRERPWRD